MAVTQGITNQFLIDLANGVNFSGHSFKIALYLQTNASLDPTTAAYTSTGEITGTGYTATGKVLTGFTIGQDAPTGTAYFSWADPIWTASDLAADSALIYDATANHSVAVLSYSYAASDPSTGDFHLFLPPVGAGAIITIQR